MTKIQSEGVAFNTVNFKSRNGLVLIENKSSINETFNADCRRSLHKCWQKAIARDVLNVIPKAIARPFEIVTTRDCDATFRGPSDSFPSRN